MSPEPVSAPATARFCAGCGGPMDTRTVGNRPRRVCRFCGAVHFPDPKVGVGVLAVRDDELLLVRRAVAPEIGRWSVPGGFLDAGENPRAAAARETLAEATSW